MSKPQPQLNPLILITWYHSPGSKKLSTEIRIVTNKNKLDKEELTTVLRRIFGSSLTDTVDVDPEDAGGDTFFYFKKEESEGDAHRLMRDREEHLQSALQDLRVLSRWNKNWHAKNAEPKDKNYTEYNVLFYKDLAGFQIVDTTLSPIRNRPERSDAMRTELRNDQLALEAEVRGADPSTF